MAINFDNLPGSRPAGSNIPSGTYPIQIEKAEMKQPKDKTKKQYLNLTYNVFDTEGKQIGKVWDKLFESESSYIQWKIKRFVEALELPLKSFELKDLAKLVVGKKLKAELVQKTEDNKTTTEVDIFGDNIFLPFNEKAEAVLQDADDEDPFNTEESEDNNAVEY